MRDEDTLPFSQEHLAELELKRSPPNYPYALKLMDEALSSRQPLLQIRRSTIRFIFARKSSCAPEKGKRHLRNSGGLWQRPKAWRQGALPGDTTNTQTVVLLHEVYQDFAHLAAQISLETKDAALRDEALQVLASNRAASLREQLKLALATDSKTAR